MAGSKTSTTSSPDYGTKGDDVTPNGSSESAWEKQSESSQGGGGTKDGESGKRESDTTSWADDAPAPAPAPVPASLRDAPPPAVNFWDQRKAQAKARAVNPAEAVNSKKVDSQKKTKATSGLLEGNSVPNGIKERVQAADVKPRSEDEGMY